MSEIPCSPRASRPECQRATKNKDFGRIIAHALDRLETRRTPVKPENASNGNTANRRSFVRQTAATAVALALLLACSRGASAGQSGDKLHLVFVVGTHHYSPQVSMPVLAKEMERFGCRTTVILPPGDPEGNKNGVGIPGLEALAEADVAVFFVRFLTLDDEQFGHIEKYVRSGKPVVAFRTSTHAFRYGAGHARFAWNDDFGRDVQGTDYLCHMRGSTECRLLAKTKTHPILTGVGSEPFTAAGTLYLTDLQPGCVPLVIGSGSSNAERLIRDRFRTRHVQKNEEDIVAWTWDRNKYGARVFATSFGHLGDFAVPQIMRITVNGIHWAAGVDVPDASTEIRTFQLAAKKAGGKRGGTKGKRR
jgi:type 1 glutamine amidotransferase